MKNVSGKDNKESLLYTCTVSIVGGVFISAIYPPWAIVGTLSMCGGILTMAYTAWNYNTFDKLFRNLDLGVDGAYPFLKKKIKNDTSTVYKFTLPCGLCLKDFEDKRDSIEQYLGRDIEMKYTYKEIYIEVFESKMKTMYEYEPTEISGDIPIIIGYDRRENLITCDLASGEPHMLIAGETGSGKSTVLRSMITNLILKSKVKLHLVDLKNGTEFSIFRNSSRVEDFCRTISETERLLTDLCIETDRRYNLFYNNNVKDIKEYNKKFKNKKLDYHVLIIDEFADLQENRNCTSMLERLCRICRSSGQSIILATQRPDHKVLTGAIKANVTTILGLKTLNGTNSNIIINEQGLERLKGAGNAIFKRGCKVEVQAPFLESDRARELVKPTNIDKRNKAPKEEQIDNFDFMEVL